MYVAGAGPVGLAAATSAQLLGAATVIVGDLNADRLAQARSFGCETVDVSLGDPAGQIEQILGVPEVDCGIDAVGFEARGHGHDAGTEQPATVLNSLMEISRAGGSLGFAKSHTFVTGQCPVMKYHRGLMQAILADKVSIAKNVNATAIGLDQAPQGYAAFDEGAAQKFVLDPHGLISA